jgi:hypothetical protein
MRPAGSRTRERSPIVGGDRRAHRQIVLEPVGLRLEAADDGVGRESKEGRDQQADLLMRRLSEAAGEEATCRHLAWMLLLKLSISDS